MYCWIGFIPIPLINVGMEFPIPQNTINNVLLDWVHPHTIGMEFPIPPNTINIYCWIGFIPIPLINVGMDTIRLYLTCLLSAHHKLYY